MSKLPKWFQEEIENPEKIKVNDKVKADRQEKAFAKRTKALGGRRQPASGAFWSAKGDVSIGKYALGDNKHTKHKSYSITKATWQKIKQEALQQNKQIPFLQLEMAEVEALVVLSENDFLMLLESYINAQ